MPEKNGYEVCEEIKKNPATARIPVVLLAGTFEPFDRERAERLGCDAIVSKPFDSHQLFLKVESLFAGKSDGGRTTSPAAPAPRDTAVGALHATPFPASVPPDPFSAGFAEEDFTGSIRNLRGMGRDEPLENLYGPEDVESALEAFREVEPTARAADWRAAAQPSPTARSGSTSPNFARRRFRRRRPDRKPHRTRTPPILQRLRRPRPTSSPTRRSRGSPRRSRESSSRSSPTASCARSPGKSCPRPRSSRFASASASSRAASSSPRPFRGADPRSPTARSVAIPTGF